MPTASRRVPLVLFLVLLAALVGAAPAFGASTLVISQVYGGGGNAGAQYTNDFVELFNRGTTSVSLTGMSVQYASATGTGNFGSNPVTALAGTLAPGQYYLVQLAGAATGAPLPAPDATGTVNMSGSSGKVILANSTTGIACNGSVGQPCSPAQLAQIVDLVGYGSANFFEGAGAAPTLSSSTAGLRNDSGCVDSDNNAADFAAAAPGPRNAISPVHFCPADQPPSVTSRSPAGGATGVAVGADLVIGFSEPVDVSGSWFSLTCAASGSHAAAVSGGPTTFILDPAADFVAGEACTVTVFGAQVTDRDAIDPPDTMAADETWTFTTETSATPIHDIQGASHVSPLLGLRITTSGIVTATRSNGFYLQDPTPDADTATSEAIFVFTSSSPNAAVGDAVRVSGRVAEFRPGGSSSANLTTTELTSPTTTIVSSGNSLPAPTTVGTGGRIPPDTVIEDDATGDVETSGVFDPATDGLDFWESLEGMLVQLNDAVAVGPTNAFGETPIVGDDGAHAGVRTARGGLLLRPDDPNPERVVADDAIVPLPSMNVGDHYSGPIVGVLDYNFGNFFVEVTNSVGRVDGGLQRETTAASSPADLSVATFNFENLAATNDQAKFDRLAGIIVSNLRSPDLIAGEEVQDDNGAVDDGTVTATQTLTRLTAAIQAAGGPAYAWREIDPVNDQDGGAPGGNIRQVLLFRSDRGLSFVDRPGGTSTAAAGVTGSGASTHLTFSPGRVDPTNAAWSTSRKPLAAELSFRGHRFFVVANHFNSKSGDQPLSGHFQPPVPSSETQRHQQAQVVADFVGQITAADPGAAVVVLGDLNDFEFSQTVSILETAGLSDLMDTLPLTERYSYEFEGNAQVLDHVLVTPALAAQPLVFDPVHVNAEFFDQASDHDPSIVRIALDEPPTVTAGGPYTVGEGGDVTVSAVASDPEGGAVSYAWDLNDDGVFETAGRSATFSAAGVDGPASRTVVVRAVDASGQTATASATVDVVNVAPTAVLVSPAGVLAGSSFALGLTSPSDPSAADTAAGFTYSFDCGGGYDAFGVASSASCPTSDVGTLSVGARIADKDGGVTEYRGSVSAFITFAGLCDLTKRLVAKDEVASSLCAKLLAAADAAARGNANAKAGQLLAYRNEVAAQTGKTIVPADATLLTLLSTRL